MNLSSEKDLTKNNLLVLASTFPRWKGDSTPGFVLDFCKHIKPYINDVRVLAPHYDGAKSKEIVEDINIKRFRYWWPASGQDIAYQGGAVQKIKKSILYILKLKMYVISLFFNTLYISLKNTHIINAHWIIPQGFVAILVKMLTGRKVIITVHGGDVFTLNQKMFKKIKKFVLKRADVVVANSSATKNACEEIYPSRLYEVIPMGVDVMQKFTPREKNKKLAERYDLRDFTVLFVGRLSEEKGVIYLCEAVKALVKEDEKIRLLVVGDGPEKSRINTFVKDSDLEKNIILVGWVQPDELVDYYNIADVFVGPSVQTNSGWQEAFGLVFVEALATGTPVISTNTGGISDIVKDGKNGYLVKQKDPTAIASKLTILKNDPALMQELKNTARKRIVEKFSWNAVIQAYLKVLSSDTK